MRDSTCLLDFSLFKSLKNPSVTTYCSFQITLVNFSSSAQSFLKLKKAFEDKQCLMFQCFLKNFIISSLKIVFLNRNGYVCCTFFSLVPPHTIVSRPLFPWIPENPAHFIPLLQLSTSSYRRSRLFNTFKFSRLLHLLLSNPAYFITFLIGPAHFTCCIHSPAYYVPFIT